MSQIKKVNNIFLITVMFAVGGSLFMGAFSVGKDNELFSLLAAQLLYVIPAILYLKSSGGNIKERLRFNRIKGSTMILLILFSYLITPLLTYLNIVSMLFSKNMIQNTIDGIVKNYPMAVGIIAVGLIPCILEETIYRGVFFNEYRKINPRKGILISGFLFGLMHMNWNQFVYAFVMGMIFAVLVEASDSIIASMIVHFTINTTSVVTAYIQSEMAFVTAPNEMVLEEEQLKMYLCNYWIVVVFFGILAFFLLKQIAKNQGRKEELNALFFNNGKEKEVQAPFFTLPLVLGSLICIFIMIGVEVL
ncbi:CPBP family intramembrane glutamic endopeptidase [Velocimicrobium porci]|uniref:CPBP family intramembrane metalloprotease n=1 Tax=Velocimicrobium porci TaxID=2606634 RepID=A0A6L5XZC6_9FIRM|nr:type II CAAX endopeptidase family protein [Velocimicrobium porci]MSS64226.1 CPBP family intramembrane metalloprotease [Velocimicrobium porci]